MLPLLRCFFCSFTHLTIPRSPPKFNQLCSFLQHLEHTQGLQLFHNYTTNFIYTILTILLVEQCVLQTLLFPLFKYLFIYLFIYVLTVFLAN